MVTVRRSDPALENVLKEKVRIHGEHVFPAVPNVAFPLVLCTSNRAVAPEARRLRALAPQAPILVFGPYADASLAREALRAGANGFIHARMTPEQISRILSTVSKNEVVMPREILGAFLADMVESREDLRDLTPRQRKILEQVVEEPVNRSEIAVPKEFSEAFLEE
jgi:DNA-binding NarL/FixJ family response regulator